MEAALPEVATSDRCDLVLGGLGLKVGVLGHEGFNLLLDVGDVALVYLTPGFSNGLLHFLRYCDE